MVDFVLCFCLGISMMVNVILLWRSRITNKALDELALYYLFEKLED